jgi:flagellar protein FliO/FliZ
MALIGGMPDAVKFIIVFLVILGILVPLLWRRFGIGSRAPLSARGRQPRLAVIDTATVDVRRKLVLIKRDSVEHLLLIGGPSDIVVESGISRTATVPREPRPIPEISQPDVSRQPVAADAPNWSLPLEQMTRPARTVDLDAALPEPSARTAREAMADSMRAVRSGAAARRNATAELNTVPEEEIAAPALMPAPAEVNHRPPPVQQAPEPRRAAAPELQRPLPAPEPAALSADASELKRERMAPPGPRPAPAAAASAPPAAPSPARPVQPASAPAAVPLSTRPASSDESNLAEMAQRLEAALRRPTKPEAAPPSSPARQQARPEPAAGRRQAGPGKVGLRSAEPPPDLKVMPGKGKTESAIESLEDEMAKMLGRPGKL